MTDKIKSAISEIENMRKFNYTLAPNEVFDLAINSLKAWEEVLHELSQLTSCSGHKDHKNNCGGCAGCVECKLEDAYHVVIDIIKKKLAEIEE